MRGNIYLFTYLLLFCALKDLNYGGSSESSGEEFFFLTVFSPYTSLYYVCLETGRKLDLCYL